MVIRCSTAPGSRPTPTGTWAPTVTPPIRSCPPGSATWPAYRPWPEAFHVFHATAGLVPEADEAVAAMGAFLRTHLA